jgi:multidrug efflux pump subunit AcrA (membrane-fusion protein)
MPEPRTDDSDKNLSRKIRRYSLILLIAALCLAAWGEVSRLRTRSALGKETADAAEPTVLTTTPNRTTLGEELVLPGAVQAYIEAPIYARTSGYLKGWRTDIGTQVTKGQLLGEIETPEVDQQLSQAEADLATAHANESLSNSTNVRWKGLLATESVSKQDADEKAGDAAAKKAASDSAAANVSRLRELESFKRVVAPFSGVITARNTDIGALINAGQSAGSELFRIADTHKLRIYVQVPEAYAAVTKPGLERSRPQPEDLAGRTRIGQREPRGFPRRLCGSALQAPGQCRELAPAGEYSAVSGGRFAGCDGRQSETRDAQEYRPGPRLRQHHRNTLRFATRRCRDSESPRFTHRRRGRAYRLTEDHAPE